MPRNAIQARHLNHFLEGYKHTRVLFAARTAALCLHNSGEERKWIRRIGIESSFARSVQYFLVSGSAFVLSDEKAHKRQSSVSDGDALREILVAKLTHNN